MRLTDPPFVGLFPRWSPDGTRIYVASGLQTYVVAATGGKPVQLIAGPNAHLEPALSPDGKAMAFSDGYSNTLPTSTKAIYLYNLETRGQSKMPGSEGLVSPI